MQTSQQTRGYVDSGYLEVTEAYMHPVKQRSYELMRVGEGQAVLDLGCGVGIDTLELAKRTGPSGEVFGVDRDRDMIEEASRRALRGGVSDRIRYRLGEATNLAFSDSFFDACRCERLLMHVTNSMHVVTELHRVLKPGGWLVLIEPDWGALTIATEFADLERRLARIRAEQFLRNGYAGRNLYGWMRQANFREIAVEITPFWWNDLFEVKYLMAMEQVEAFALAENLITAVELQDWRSNLQIAQDRGSFFASLNIVMVAGRKADCV